MIELIADTIEQYKMLARGDLITVGLSGGADSVCLLLCMLELREKYSVTVRAVHINHMLRGSESERDQAFCEELCKKLGVKLFVKRFDVNMLSKKMGVGIEEGARKIRYEAFESVRDKGKIATAHTLDDAAETMIFNIARGCSIRGVCSVPAVRGNIIRPLINVSREQVERFLAAKNQDFVTDCTNSCDDYSRNKIRHKVIPVLKEINPEFLQSVRRLKENAKEKCDYFDEKSARLISDDISASSLKTLGKVEVCEYIGALCREKCAKSVTAKHINDCYTALMNNTKCQLPDNNFFYTENDRVEIGKIGSEVAEEFSLELDENIKTPYKNYTTQIFDSQTYKKMKKVNNLFLNNAVDYDKLCTAIIVRNRRAGDRIRPRNRKCTKLLKAIYNENKVPVKIRDRLIVIECDKKIVWAESVGTAEGYYPNENTKNVLIIRPEVD